MFSNKLKELRKSNDYSMDELAEIYNKKFNGRLNKSTISRYENGLQEPIFTVVRNFAELFDISVDDMIDENKYGFYSKTTTPRKRGIYIEPQGDISATIHFWSRMRRASVRDLSALTGINLSRMDDIDKGKAKDITDSEIQLLAEALDVTEQMLRSSYVPDNLTDQYVAKLNKKLSNNDLRVLELFSKLDDNDKAEIRGEIKQMLKADKYSTDTETAAELSISNDIIDELKQEKPVQTPINTK